MIFSNACGYAVRALARLAMVRPNGYVLLDELCEGSDLPRHFVAKIFQELVRQGLLTSAKGRGGGFALARAPEEISLYQIMDIIDGTEQLRACVVGIETCNTRDGHAPCPLHDRWDPIRQQMHHFLVTTTLADMSESLAEKITRSGQKLPEPHSPSKAVVR